MRVSQVFVYLTPDPIGYQSSRQGKAVQILIFMSLGYLGVCVLLSMLHFTFERKRVRQLLADGGYRMDDWVFKICVF